MLPKLPYDFICNTPVKLLWQDLGFGIKKGYIVEYVSVNFAMDYLMSGEDNALVLDLASLLPGDSVFDILDGLIENEGLKFDESKTKRKWLYLILKFIDVNNTNDSDQNLLKIVEEIYVEFEYPESISSFVRYMPMIGNDLGSKEKNISRLFESWKNYLKNEEFFFAQ